MNAFTPVTLPPIAPMVPENCRRCTLWQGCKTWKVPAEVAVSRPSDNGVDVLFVGQNPGEEEDGLGRPMVGKGGQWLRGWTNGLQGVSYAFTNAVLCHIPDHSMPLGVHIENCRPFLLEAIAKYRPKVIVALGKTALLALWPNGPNTLSRAKGVHRMADGSQLVVVDHPSQHTSGRFNLTNSYEQLMDLVCRLVAQEPTATFGEGRDIRIMRDWSDCLQAAQVLQQCDWLAWDWEVYQHPSDPQAKTLWHPRAVPLCVNFTTPQGVAYVFPLSHPESPFNVVSWAKDGTYWRPQEDWSYAKHAGPWPGLFRAILEPHIGLVNGKAGRVRKILVAHNWKYDANAGEKFAGVQVEAICYISDTLAKHFVLDQSYFGNNLGDLANRYLGMSSWWDQKDAEMRQAGVDASFADTTLDTLCVYNGTDGVATVGLEKVSWTWDLPRSYYKTLRDSRAVRRIEVRGIPMDAIALKAAEAVYRQKFGVPESPDCEFLALLSQFPKAQIARTWRRDKWDGEYHRLLNSPQGQSMGKAWVDSVVGKRPNEDKIGPQNPGFIAALAELTGFESNTLTKTGNPSYGAPEIEWYAKIDKYGKPLTEPDAQGNLQPIIPWGNPDVDVWRLLHAYKTNRYLLTTYLMPLPSFIVDGVVHPNFNVCKADKGLSASDLSGGVETSRMSTSDPNVLAIKKSWELLRAFVAPPGYRLVKFDASQLELRGMACKYGVQTLIDAFNAGTDPYKALACIMWGLQLDQVSKEKRDASKRNTLARIYQEGSKSLAKRNHLALAFVQDVEARLRAAMPELEPAKEHLAQEIETGVVQETEYGRRRTFRPDEILSAWNNLIQSPCADICTQKMDELCEACFPELEQVVINTGVGKPHSRLLAGTLPILLVHDAVLALVPEDAYFWLRVHAMRCLLYDTSELEVKWQVPLEWDLEAGPNWGDLEPIVVEHFQDTGFDFYIYKRNAGTAKAPVWQELARVPAVPDYMWSEVPF